MGSIAETTGQALAVDEAGSSGTLTILIPGTRWEGSGGWGADNPLFAYGRILAGAAAAAMQGFIESGSTRIFKWGGGNRDSWRLRAAEMLCAEIAAHRFRLGDELNIFAHSHGGNVALAASQIGLTHKIDNLITLNKPRLVGKAYAVGRDVGHFYNISARGDWLQWAGSNLKLSGKWARDPAAVNLMVDTAASDLKPHGALIWDDDVREGWWRWVQQQRSMR